MTLTPLGQGAGLHGIPADYTPTARFVGLFGVLQPLDQATDAAAAQLLALHVCNTFDIRQGAARERAGHPRCLG